MKETPILFGTDMVKAILDGKKTATRRIIKPQPGDTAPEYMPTAPVLGWEEIYRETWKPWHWETVEGESIAKFCPYGSAGDLLWVRETFADMGNLSKEPGAAILYKANGCQPIDNRPWTPSIFMPKAIARIWLLVTNIRVQRLHDISPHDACEEGVNYWNIDADALEGGELQADFENYTWTEKKEKDPNYEDRWFPSFANPVDSFRSLWQRINGMESWSVNPWVWVVEFKALSTTGRENIPNDIPKSLTTDPQSHHI